MIHETPGLRDALVSDAYSPRTTGARALSLIEGTTPVPGRFTTPHPFGGYTHRVTERADPDSYRVTADDGLGEHVDGPDAEDVKRLINEISETGDAKGWTVRWPFGTFVRSGGDVPTRDPLEGEASGDVVRVDPPSAWTSSDELTPSRITATALIDEDGQLCLCLRIDGELVGEASTPGDRVTLAVEMP